MFRFLGLASILALLGACDSRATPPAGDGAVGFVNQANAGAAEGPRGPMGTAGGPSGQTPMYGKAAGAPGEERESRAHPGTP